MINHVNTLLSKLKKSDVAGSYSKGTALYEEARCQVLSRSGNAVDLLISDDGDEDVEVSIEESGNELNYILNGEKIFLMACSTAAMHLT